MKKFICFFISVLMLLSIVSPGRASASEQSRISLEKAITIAKDTFKLNTEGYDFTYEYIENQESRNIWRLSWNTKKAPSKSIYVTIDSNTGEVISMDKWEYTNTVPSRIPKYSKDQALKAAQEIAQKMQPVNFKETMLYEDTKSGINPGYISGDTYEFMFMRLVNGIAMPDNGIRVVIDKNSLALRGYSFSWDTGSFPDPQKAMNIDSAKKIFSEKLGIELSYRMIYNYENKTQRPILVYTLKNGSSPIDAISGEVIKNFYRGPGTANEKSMDAAGMQNQSSITPEEQSSIDISSKFISKEQAVEIIRKYVPFVGEYKLNQANLYTNPITKLAYWNLSWRSDEKDTNGNDISNYVNGQVNALTSELISFNIYGNKFNPDPDAQPVYTRENAKEIAERFIKEIQPEKFATTENRDFYYADEYSIKYPAIYNFYYVSRQNGATCPFDTFNVSVNSQTGQILSYNLQWENVELPSTQGALSINDAYKALYDKVDFSMKYIKRYDYIKSENGSPEIRLAYVLGSFTGMLDAKTGIELDYSGKPVKLANKTSYSDIKGHSSEKDIQLLVQMGIIEDTNTKYSPNSQMLQKDFIKLLIKAVDPYVSIYSPGISSTDEYEKYYQAALDRKIISEKEKSPNTRVTRQSAAKMLVRALNVGFVADLQNIYILPFKDTKSIDSQYRSYAAISSELKMVTAQKGYFNPKRYILRGEAATMLVNFLRVDVNVKE